MGPTRHVQGWMLSRAKLNALWERKGSPVGHSCLVCCSLRTLSGFWQPHSIWYMVYVVCSVCVCVCVVYVYMSSCVCTFVHVWVEATGWSQIPSSFTLYCMFWDRVSRWTRTSSIRLRWLVSEAQGSSCLHRAPWHTHIYHCGYGYLLPHPDFYKDAGIKLCPSCWMASILAAEQPTRPLNGDP